LKKPFLLGQGLGYRVAKTASMRPCFSRCPALLNFYELQACREQRCRQAEILEQAASRHTGQSPPGTWDAREPTVHINHRIARPQQGFGWMTKRSIQHQVFSFCSPAMRTKHFCVYRCLINKIQSPRLKPHPGLLIILPI